MAKVFKVIKQKVNGWWNVFYETYVPAGKFQKMLRELDAKEKRIMEQLAKRHLSNDEEQLLQNNCEERWDIQFLRDTLINPPIKADEDFHYEPHVVTEEDEREYMREWMRNAENPIIISTAMYLGGPEQYLEDVKNGTVGENSGYFRKKYNKDGVKDR